MHERYAAMDRILTRLTAMQVSAIALAGIVLVGLMDYATGYEISFSLFYLGPVALAAWYAGRRNAIAIAVLAAGVWLSADTASGHPYTHPLITMWELLVRLGVFLMLGLSLVALRAALNRERDLARTDVLTGLSTRRAFEEQLEHDLKLVHRRHGSLTLAFLDLDDFKRVNDSYGHAEGDRVLRITGRVLKDSIREADTVARLGGDEFVLVLPDTNPHGAAEAISKIRRDLRLSLAAGAPKALVTFSVGAITFLEAPQNKEEALKATDDLMYAAKHRGKGTALFRVVKKQRAEPHVTPSHTASSAQRRRKLMSGTHNG
jgi:diguanylate cyclase (GGDEF)-like protein